MLRFLLSAVAALVMTGVAASAQETPLARGKYLMRSIVACGNCHTPKDADGKPIADRELAGGVAFNTPIYHAVAPNITPDKETGIGDWTDDGIINAIRNGRRPHGSIIGPPMPIPVYRDMSDSDARAIVAYLRQVKPIENRTEKSHFHMRAPDYGPPVTSVPDVPRSDKVAYGRYLATALGACMYCHTPEVEGRLDTSRLGAGGNQYELPGGAVITSANLTPGNPDGIAKWTDAQIKTAITEGRAPDRPLVRYMPFDWYKNMSEEDLDALVAFLRTLKPVASD